MATLVEAAGRATGTAFALLSRVRGAKSLHPRGRVYEGKSTEMLTWSNLGNWLGARYGARPTADIDETFECFAEEYRRSRDR